MSGKFAVLVGNGFTTDFLSHHGGEFNSSKPLRNFNNELITYKPYVDFMPSIKRELANSTENDFLQIEDFVKINGRDVQKFGHLRQFLALSYSELQFQVDKYTYENWKWFNWLNTNNNHLVCAISLNYDLILERVLKNTNTSFFRSGTTENRNGIPILKPHGSIDFEAPNPEMIVNFVDITKDQLYKYRLQYLSTLRNDFGFLQVLNDQDLLFPRFEADIIPPSMFNFQLNLRWVKQQHIDFLTISSSIENFIIIGSSYWDVDRPEIDFYLENLPKNVTIYIGTKDPHPDLVRKLFFLGLKHRTFDFDELPW